jgi:hypothetical protein
MARSVWTIRTLAAVALISICVPLSACGLNSEAREQQQYARAVANDVITKFIIRDSSDPGRILGAYAVVPAQQTDSGAIWCSYEPPTATSTTSAPSQNAVSSYVRVLKVEPRMDTNQIHYSLLAANDALNVMVEQAPSNGDGLSRIADILGSRKAGYDPFPSDAQGTRHFLFTSCRLSA